MSHESGLAHHFFQVITPSFGHNIRLVSVIMVHSLTFETICKVKKYLNVILIFFLCSRFLDPLYAAQDMNLAMQYV